MAFFRGLIISLIFHTLVWLILVRLPVIRTPFHKTPNPVPVEVVYKPEPLQDHVRQVVRAVQIPPHLKDDNSDKGARFFSETRQRVKQEMRAAKVGMTANQNESDMQLKKPIIKRRRPPSLHKLLHTPTSRQGLSVAQENHQANEPLRMFPGVAVSTVGEQLPPDIEVGSMTALNTDRFLFYSFYARIETLVRYRWVQLVRAAINDAKMRGQYRPRPDQQWVTALQVDLDPDGHFIRANITQASGWRALDMAPVVAFHDASPIPHPPPEMVKEDGMIHVRYGFVVNPQ